MYLGWVFSPKYYFYEYDANVAIVRPVILIPVGFSLIFYRMLAGCINSSHVRGDYLN